MHINHLPIALVPTNRGRHHDQRILVDKVAYTSFVFRAVAVLGNEFEFEG